MKKSTKILAFLLTFVLMFGIFALPAFAGDDPFNLTFEKSTKINTAVKPMNSVIGSIIYVAQIVGSGVAVIMLLVLAIKYISAAPNDKAEIKKHAIVYVVGAVILFSSTAILQIIKSVSGIIEPGTGV